MLNEIIERLKDGQFEDISKSTFNLSIPISRSRINEAMAYAIQDKSGIEKLEVKSISKKIIKLKLTLGQINLAGASFDLISRELGIKIHPILPPPDYLLKIEVLDGIRRIENELLEFLFNTLFENDIVDFENRIILISHRTLSDNHLYTQLIKKVVSAKLITGHGRLKYDLIFRF